MATMPTTQQPLEAPAAPPARLWQLPFFLVGVGVFVYVYMQRPTLVRDSEGRVLERDLVAIRSYLTRSAADATTALNLAEHARERVTAFPQRAGEVAFLLGSAHARKAELLADPLKPDASSEPLKAREHWVQARKNLDLAATLGVPDADRPRLQYRLGKTCFALGESPERVVQLLSSVLDKADAPVEGHQLLLQAHLRLPKPDLQAALEINKKLRQVQLISPNDLAEAQLQAGEILLQLGQPEEARGVLKLINGQAPAPVLSRSRYLTARSLQDEGRFDQAVNLWKLIASDTREPVTNLGRVYYDMGYCFRRNEQPKEAANAWDLCLRHGNGPEQRAAAVLLAELLLMPPEPLPERALEILEAALAGVRAPADWQKELIELNRLLELCERAIPATAASRRDLAVRWTTLYQKVAGPGRAQQLRADLLARQGRDLLDSLLTLAPGDQPEVKAKATKNLREAARTYSEAATLTVDDNTRADLLWKAASADLLTQDTDPAIERLTRLLKLLETKDAVIEQKIQRRGQAWYTLAETLRQANSPKAEEAYQNCIGTLGPYPYRARYQLALYALRRGELDDAEQTLKQNLQLLRFEKDDEAHERSLFALGGLYFQQTKYQDVVRVLEEALGRFPANPEATRAHLQLAQSYRQLSNQQNLTALTNIYKTEEAREHFKREHRRWLTKAAAEFTELARFLETQEAAGHLTPEERVQIPFAAGECRFDLGQYDEAAAIYNHLAERHKGTVDGLNALGGSVRCYAALGQSEPLRRRLNDIRGQLALMDEAVRGPWEDWLTIASKPLPQEPGQPRETDTRSMSPVRQPGQLQPDQLAPGDLQPTPMPMPAPPTMPTPSIGPERINPNPPG